VAGLVIDERADVLARLIDKGFTWAHFEGEVALASEGYCPRCGDVLQVGPLGPGIGWCPTCLIGWQVVVTVWEDARDVTLDRYDPAGRCTGSHGWIDNR
jgi:hypothetical protein